MMFKNKVGVLAYLLTIMPIGVTFFWVVGVTAGVPGALLIVPIIGYGFNALLIALVLLIDFPETTDEVTDA